ncbi:beta-xylosidase/alpha-l-arabinosidase [Arthrobacter subterraneus]|uniref:beta-xylosidase/alpha-l-arabinosidase n=1 Tax=Arthrobacter subterraneus TaxID=335973 RepID=UPI00381F8734
MSTVTESVRAEHWQDASASPSARAADLVARMTLEEKAAQLVGVWVGADASGTGVAPLQKDLAEPIDWNSVTQHGLGQLTRPFGTAPVEPVAAARSLAASQQHIAGSSRFGIPAIVHEECLAGLAAWRATAYPVPLAWGATFNPALTERMANLIGQSMRSAGIHQGLAPVLDVTRDYRWGRTEETISEDPYLVGAIGAAYVRGLEHAGIIATLKHFAGYSASRAGRNLAPVSMGQREFADVILPPFEAALRHGGARSVMHSYTEIDGVPSAADKKLLTTILRGELGFEGTVVADYFGIRFLERLHRIAEDGTAAAGLALDAGVDVELPTVDTFGAPLIDGVREGRIAEELVDRAAHRVLTQKISIGLLDDDWNPLPEAIEDLDFDTEQARELSESIARQSLILLKNDDGALPLKSTAKVALVGPLADNPMAMLGCYSFPAHVGSQHPEVPLGIDIPSVLDEMRTVFGSVQYVEGCTVDGPERDGIAEAVSAAQDAEVCVIVLGDRAGLFGRGTSGEGCDAGDLQLPGVQSELLEAVLATGTPVVVVLLAGRPYALGSAAEKAAAIVQGFFPGQRGGRAVSALLAGEYSPSGRLPVSIPREPGSQPGTYLAPPLGMKSGVSNLDPTPAFPFGHGLGYTSFEWSDVREQHGRTEWPVDGEVTIGATVTNTGEVRGADVVELYLHDPVAQVTRPLQRLIGFARVELDPGESARVSITVSADLTAFTGIEGRRIVEPGDVELRIARSSADIHTALNLRLTGPVREVGADRALLAVAETTSRHERERAS